MNFGDWEMFKVMIVSLREHELTLVTQAEEGSTKNVRFSIKKQDRSAEKKRDSVKREEQEKDLRRSSSTASKHSIMENQVRITIF